MSFLLFLRQFESRKRRTSRFCPSRETILPMRPTREDSRLIYDPIRSLPLSLLLLLLVPSSFRNMSTSSFRRAWCPSRSPRLESLLNRIHLSQSPRRRLKGTCGHPCERIRGPHANDADPGDNARSATALCIGCMLTAGH